MPLALARRAARPAAPLPFADADADPQAEWLETRIGNAPLFETPFTGDAGLIPIRTTRALKDASDVFQNGMWQRLDWFLDGQEACFLTAGPVKAAITLRTDPLYGWSVSEIVGPGNAPLPPAVERKIVERLGEAGFHRRARSFPL